MPAAAVIPAPIAYIKVVAVKKLVVEVLAGRSARTSVALSPISSGAASALYWSRVGHQDCYFEKIRVFKAGLRLNTLAWNNRIGLGSIFWFMDLGND